jgi:hypothetical protein
MWLMSFLAKIFPKKRVFLDYASTTPIDREVSRAMSEVSMHYANPSALYSESIHAKKIINESKKKIASILDCQADNIYFTSGGTESNNIAILGIFSKYKTYNFTPHFITTNIERSDTDVREDLELEVVRAEDIGICTGNSNILNLLHLLQELRCPKFICKDANGICPCRGDHWNQEPVAHPLATTY